MWTKTLFVGFVLCLLKGTNAGLTVKPKNHADVIENLVTLDCTTDETNNPTVFWLTVNNDGSTSTLSTNDVPRNSTLYTITGTATPGTFNLQINSLAMSGGTTYRCTVFGNTNEDADAALISLASNPVCNTNVSGGIAVEGEYIKFTCSVDYQASNPSWAPVMEWTQVGVSVSIPPANESIPGTSEYSITIPMTPQLNGKTYQCRTYFNTPQTVPQGSASNAPSYEYTWPSPELTVQYPPYNVRLSSLDPTYNPGEQVTCSAESNPGAGFQWKDLNTNDTTNGKVLTIPGFTEGGNNEHSYVCIATNTIKGQEYSTQSSVLQFSVVPTTTTSTTTTTTTTRPPTTTTTPDPDATQLSGGAIAGIVIGCLLFLVLIGLLIIFLYRKGCLQSNKNKAANNTRPQNSRETAAKSPVGVDQVRHPQNNLDYPPKPGGGFPAGEEPPPYNTSPYGSMSREVPYHPDPMYDDPRARNAENLHYADLALDDTPRSRKPVQLYDNGTTDYAEIKRV